MRVRCVQIDAGATLDHAVRFMFLRAGAYAIVADVTSAGGVAVSSQEPVLLHVGSEAAQ